MYQTNLVITTNSITTWATAHYQLHINSNKALTLPFDILHTLVANYISLCFNITAMNALQIFFITIMLESVIVSFGSAVSNTAGKKDSLVQLKGEVDEIKDDISSIKDTLHQLVHNLKCL